MPYLVFKRVSHDPFERNIDAQPAVGEFVVIEGEMWRVAKVIHDSDVNASDIILTRSYEG